MSNMLQEKLNEFVCSELNYANNKIYVWQFYSEERYNDFLNGSKCWGSQGLVSADEVLEFNKLNDNTLVIVKHDGVETARYRYVPIFKATMEYKSLNPDKKKVNKTLTFTIRRSEFGNEVNLVDREGNSLDFYNTAAVKRHINEKYGTNKLIDWCIFDE